MNCKEKDILFKKYQPFLSIKEENNLCISNWSPKYEKILEDFYVSDLLNENLCYQKEKPKVLLSPTLTASCDDSEMINLIKNMKSFHFSHTKNDGYTCYHIFKREIETEIEKTYVPPKLKKCQVGEKPGTYYENCCPSEEYNMLMFKRKLEEFNGFLEKKEIKTETKQVFIPVGKPLTVDQMGLLEATIYSTFTVLKFFMK